jgi:Tfp pilus assembly protein PilV
VRNIVVAVTNGTITLVILLIAPLGLAAVIANTVMVAFATFFVAQTADRVILFLQRDRLNASIEPSPDDRIQRRP